MSSVAREQERNLKIVAAVAGALVLLLVAAAVALYAGAELPPYEMRHSLSAPTGYAPPPNPTVLPAGVVVRGSLARAASPSPREAETFVLGKRVYDTNCGMCHGVPGQGPGPVGRTYSPHPPDLAGYFRRHSDEEYQRAVSEGIRSTPSPEAEKYLPVEWHSFRKLLTGRERRATSEYLRSAH